MEEKINLLQQEYLETPVPVFLENHGFSDVKNRIMYERALRFKLFKRYAFVSSFVLIALIGIGGMVAAATPNSPFYNLKNATRHTFQNFTNTTPSVAPTHGIEQFVAPQLASPTATLTPTPTQKHRPAIFRSKIEAPESENDDEFHKPETGVKGISTFRFPTETPRMTSPVPTTSPSSHGNSNENSDHGQSRNQDNENNHSQNEGKGK